MNKKQARLKVAYTSPKVLLSALTKSIGQGGVCLESKQPLPVGTQFVFEMRTMGVQETVEVFGTVMAVRESGSGGSILDIRYDLSPHRHGLNGILQAIFATKDEKLHRQYPRIPLNVQATEDTQHAITYRLRDISQSGVGIDVEGKGMPPYIHVGAPLALRMKLSTGLLALQGTVMWTVNTSHDIAIMRFGMAFSEISQETREMLNDLLMLRSLPAPPWVAHLTFDAATAQ